MNKIWAVVDKRLVAGGVLVGIILVVIGGGYLGLMANEGMVIWKALALSGATISGLPFFLWNRENKAVGEFNRYTIRRK